MTDEQIIKASECCHCYRYCEECPCDDFCDGHPIEAAVDLMKRQKTEIERLKELNAMIIEAGQLWEQRYKTARADAAREIFKEIEKCRVVGSYGIHCYLKSDVDELLRKNAEGGNE